jgi:hypothetical protein
MHHTEMQEGRREQGCIRIPLEVPLPVYTDGLREVHCSSPCTLRHPVSRLGPDQTPTDVIRLGPGQV